MPYTPLLPSKSGEVAETVAETENATTTLEGRITCLSLSAKMPAQ